MLSPTLMLPSAHMVLPSLVQLEKVSVCLFILVAHEGFVLAVDLNQARQDASGFLEKPCSFNCAAPGGRECEGFNAAFLHAGYQVFDCVIADGVVQVEVLVAAVLGGFISAPDALLCAA